MEREKAGGGSERESVNRHHICETDTSLSCPLPLKPFWTSSANWFYCQEYSSSKKAHMVRAPAARSTAANHVLWFPGSSGCASWLLLALGAECGKVLRGRLLSRTLGECATVSLSSRGHQQASVSAWGAALTRCQGHFRNHREKAHFWRASRPALKSWSQGLKEQRNRAVGCLRLRVL